MDDIQTQSIVPMACCRPAAQCEKCEGPEHIRKIRRVVVLHELLHRSKWFSFYCFSLDVRFWIFYRFLIVFFSLFLFFFLISVCTWLLIVYSFILNTLLLKSVLLTCNSESMFTVLTTEDQPLILEKFWPCRSKEANRKRFYFLIGN